MVYKKGRCKSKTARGNQCPMAGNIFGYCINHWLMLSEQEREEHKKIFCEKVGF